MATQDAPTQKLEGDISDSPYAKFQGDDLILRDELAVDRTRLANERTLLAYLRSAVGLLIAGVTIMHFAREAWFWGVGVACLPAGVIAGIVGVARYWRMSRSISAIRKRSEAKQSAGAPEETGTAEQR
jgi:putative membrane protein